MSSAPPVANRPALHLTLLLLTLFSTFSAYLVGFSGVGAADLASLPASIRAHPGALMESLTFALAVVAILGTHEMGHYLLAKRHGVDTSLPYFIPIPFLGFGTMGAVIRLRSRIPSKNALVDIGAAGPIAGLCVALPVMIVGIATARVGSLPPAVPDTFPTHASLISLFRNIMEAIANGGAEPAHDAATSFGNNLFTLLIQYVVRGPLPEGQDLYANPLFLAGWFGLLVTMLNLIPVGQLDGGHVAHAVFGKHAPTVGKVMAVGMAFLCLCVSASWLLWLLLTSTLIGFNHPPVVDEEAPLSPARKWISGICAVALILCVMPLPIDTVILR